MNFIGNRYKMTPLTDAHYDVLCSIAKAHPDVYRYTTLGQSSADFARWFVTAKQQNAWVVVRCDNEQVVGSTRLYNHNETVGSVNIGYTWFHPDCRGTGVNDEAKILLLTHMFETLKYNRVVFEINADNAASRRAVEKLGAILEGTLNQSLRTPSGEVSDGCIYALFAYSWPTTKEKLQQKTGII